MKGCRDLRHIAPSAETCLPTAWAAELRLRVPRRAGALAARRFGVVKVAAEALARMSKILTAGGAVSAKSLIYKVGTPVA